MGKPQLRVVDGGVHPELRERWLAFSTAEKVEHLYERYRGLVFHLALRYGRGRAAWAEDLTQEVFLHLFEVVGRLHQPDDLGAWFYRVTTNRCLNRLRRERFLDAAPVRWVLRQRQAPAPTLESLTNARAELRVMFDVLDQLPCKQRVAFCMYHLDGKNMVEIGRILGHSKGYICKLIKRAEASVCRFDQEAQRG